MVKPARMSFLRQEHRTTLWLFAWLERVLLRQDEWLKFMRPLALILVFSENTMQLLVLLRGGQ